MAKFEAAAESVKNFQDAVDQALVSVEALHAGIDDLPTEHLTNVSLVGEDEILEQVAEIREYVDALPDERTILVRLDTTGLGEAAAAGVGAEGLSAGDAEAAAAAVDHLADAEGDLARDAVEAAAAQGHLNDQMGETVVAAAAAGAATVAAGNSARTAANTTQAATRIFGLTGNAIHWIIAGGAEILAVTIPALFALGSAAAVGLQGFTNIYEHVKAVYGATEATGQQAGQTAGELMGLKGALQAAQNAANPVTYDILGSAIITLNEHFGDLWQTGTQVLDLLETFAAKVAVEFGPGGDMGSATTELLSHMTADLQGIGQLFGNLGHALLSFASQMPGLAEILLGSFAKIAGALSDVIQFAARFQIAGASILTVFMGFEEFNRWGGLLANTLTKLGLASASLTGGPFSFARMGSVIQGLLSVFPTLIGYVGKFATAIGAEGAGSAISTFAKDTLDAIKGLSVLQAGLLGAALVGLGFVIDQMVTYQSAAQKFTASLQEAALAASNVQSFQTIAENIGQINTQLAQVAATAPKVVSGLGRGAYVEANPAIAQLNAGLKQQQQDMANVSAGAAYLASTYHTSLVGAMALADGANVKLANGILGTGQNAEVARMQIASLVAGYKAMGAPLTAVGSDTLALAIQSGLAGTKVSELNQAWDQFMQDVTGGTDDLANLVQSIQNIGSVAATTTGNLSTGTGQVSLSTAQFAAALKSFSGNGAQAWQNFDQVVGSTAPQLIDWMRTAGAEGALSGPQFTQGVLDMASALTGLASESPVAQSNVLDLVHEVEPSITTWGQLTEAIKKSGASLSGLGGIIGPATIAMGNMSQVAQNLGNATQTALLSTLSTAKVMASGVGTAMQQYEQALMNGSTNTATLRQKVITDFEKMGISAQQAAQIIDAAIAGIPTYKNIRLDVQYETTTGAGQSGNIRGHAAGTPSASAGWAWVGEAGPELVRFGGGETVVPNHALKGYADGAGGWYDGGGFFPGLVPVPVPAGVSAGATGGGGGAAQPLHVHLMLDGREMATAMIPDLVGATGRYSYRNSGKSTGILKPT